MVVTNIGFFFLFGLMLLLKSTNFAKKNSSKFHQIFSIFKIERDKSDKLNLRWNFYCSKFSTLSKIENCIKFISNTTSTAHILAMTQFQSNAKIDEKISRKSG